MKFHCDRCNTRYSIADERVRGKILKIRCKSCAAVITVREGMDSPSSSGSMEALPVALPQAQPREAHASTSSRQPTVEAPPLAASVPQAGGQPDREAGEWYLSRGGEQAGPLSLAEARAWVAGQGAGAEIFCWRPGFADWTSTTQVAELHPAAAEPAAAARPPTEPPAPPGASAGPLPASAASSGQVAKVSDDMFAAAAGDDLDLDIGEPSRVVKLDMLQAHRSAAASAPGTPGTTPGSGQQPALPGMAPGAGNQRITGPARALGRGTGSVPALGQEPAAAMPLSDLATDDLSDLDRAEPRRRSSLPLIAGGVALLFVATGALAFVVLGDSDGDPGNTVTGNTASDFENLGYQLDKPSRKSAPLPDDSPDPGPDRGDIDEPDPRSKRGASRTRRNKSAAATGGRDRRDRDPDSQADQAEDTTTEPRDLTPLSPEDVIRQSNRSQIGFQRCYERAKKKDPFLEVRSIKIDLAVDAAGQVHRVALSSHDDSFLGACLKARIGRWTFRPSTKGINTQISLAFERR